MRGSGQLLLGCRSQGRGGWRRKQNYAHSNSAAKAEASTGSALERALLRLVHDGMQAAAAAWR